eukprot:TRINITY_DN48019_c0_g2_i1.p1 TRINITY_DN48019_c0_g2~~TRINITY_DN48019_c0_g2_i1.p1  ORF type:complete len:221 (+),score=34.32 TRINITY_DN48019_c0_g2_i1:223-885(+)
MPILVTDMVAVVPVIVLRIVIARPLAAARRLSLLAVVLGPRPLLLRRLHLAGRERKLKKDLKKKDRLLDASPGYGKFKADQQYEAEQAKVMNEANVLAQALMKNGFGVLGTNSPANSSTASQGMSSDPKSLGCTVFSPVPPASGVKGTLSPAQIAVLETMFPEASLKADMTREQFVQACRSSVKGPVIGSVRNFLEKRHISVPKKVADRLALVYDAVSSL